MTTIQEQIEAVEKEIRETPYHKATEHHIGMLRAKIARLKDRLIESSSKKGGGKGGYAVKKQGDATVVLVGPPSVGKSTLINKLTNAKSKVAPYAFTTVSVIPGMMEYKNSRIQVLDVPGLIEGAEEGKGRGKEVLSVVRGTNLLIIIVDPKRVSLIGNIKDALERNGIRIDKKPPNVVVEKTLKGGITVHSNIKQDISKETIKELAMQFGIRNGEITIKEKVNLDDLIDVFSRSRVYIPSISVINKVDLPEYSKPKDVGILIEISALNNENLDKLKEEIWKKLEFVRVYLVRRDEEPSENNPLIAGKETTLKQVAEKIGEEFSLDKNRAKIWGPGSKFPGQEVSLEKEVEEGMQVRFI